MTEEELKRTKEDFRDWLSHPLTELFVKILDAMREDYRKNAFDQVYNEYYKKEINDAAMVLFGKADGIDTLMSMLEDCKTEPKSIDIAFEYLEPKN